MVFNPRREEKRTNWIHYLNIENVQLMHECCEHMGRGTARMKEEKEMVEEGNTVMNEYLKMKIGHEPS